jgi:hypothetical protein
VSTNPNIPPLECFVRGEYLRNLEDSHGTVFPCLVFGFTSIPSRVPLFHFLMEDGGLWWRMPVSAFCWKRDAAPMPLDELVLWDCFSYHASVTVFSVLRNKRMQYTSRRGVVYGGEYLFTIDWVAGDPNTLNTGFSEEPGQHKCGHFIKLDNGNYAIQPNNRVRLHDPSFTIKNPQAIPHRKLNSHVWTVENNPKWLLENSDAYNYNIEQSE